MPYRQLAERGFAAPDDGVPLVALNVSAQSALPVSELLDRLPDVPTPLSGGGFDLDDEEYARKVGQVIRDEIGSGAGANFVLRRTYTADIGGYSPLSALSLFRRLLLRERGVYWTFLVHAAGHTLVGASPERHVSFDGATAVMNPISGTYRYSATGPTLQGVTKFLADRKETDELYMVLDEELKMMGRICKGGGRVTGPYLKEMAHLAHTEYLIEGRSDRDVREILRETLFAPTVTGSPLQSAAQVIARYEPEGRGYYAGVAALIGRNTAGQRTLDSTILLRTAHLDTTGRVSIPVGATVVRHSAPATEAAETRAKAAGLLAALQAPDENPAFAAHPEVRALLTQRNEGLSGFWLGQEPEPVDGRSPGVDLAGLSLLVVDAEDNFTAMLGHQLRSLGAEVDVRRHDDFHAHAGYDVVLLGPGPGDPTATDDPRINQLRSEVDALLERRAPLVAVCLSHQLLSARLGFQLHRRARPHQGVQHQIDLFGTAERVGFYNSFAALSEDSKRDVPGVGPVAVSRDENTGEVHALRGPHFVSMQFHAESVLTVNGPRILAAAVRGVASR
ncbi:anthranilate synthase family protein [Streptomyces sp. NPDC090499]|uniref:anthranilate synthase family protein n=1 Tax=Streptomyces sp. NPDC090499 TaxID=3365965 RepID=UPI00380AAC1A